MTDLRKLLDEATPGQLAAALIKAEEALADIAGGRPTSAAFSDWHNRYQTLRAYARAALSEIEKLTGGGE